MDHVWTWGGKYFGYFDGPNLWTHDGRHVGRRSGDTIYGPNGRYIGEVMSGNRLITHKSKSTHVGGSFSPYASRVGIVKSVGYVGNVMIAGYRDFPAPEDV